MRFAAALLFAVSAPAAAQNPAALMKCVAIARDAERLACFDNAMIDSSPEARAAAKVRAAETARITAEDAANAAVVAKQRAEAEAQARRESFGAEGVASRPERFSPPPGEVQEVETGITEIMTNQSGLGVYLLENGQVWRQVDTASRPNARIGDRVKLTRGPVGGYKLNFLKQKRWVLVKRVK